MLGPDSPVSEMKGVGEGRAKSLKKLNILKVSDVLSHYPRDYEDRSRVTPIAELLPDENAVVIARIKDEAKTSYFKGMGVTKVKLYDASGSINAVWYNQPYMKNNIKPGSVYAFFGKMTIRKNGVRELQSPEMEKIESIPKNENTENNENAGNIGNAENIGNTETAKGGRWQGGLVPVYPLSAGLSQKVFRKIVRDALEICEGNIKDSLPFPVRKEYKLAGKEFSVKNIHLPESPESCELARERLVFEELFMLQTALLRLKEENISDKTGIRMEKTDMGPFFDSLPFSFTPAQKRVFDEMEGDMLSGRVMNRLVQGDVGSGKTAVAMAAAYMAVKNGFQAVMMAPTEVLAQQHYESFKTVFEPLGINTEVMTGGQKTSRKKAALAAAASGEADIIVGTHALIQEKTEFKNIGLVITDEQHRFGVRQRQTLAGKGESPHVLVMTATPIPRTLALILYGDLDISVIDSLPPGRQTIDTFAVNSSYRQRIYNFTKKEIEKGRQAYIICAMVEENEKVEAESVLKYAEELKDTVLGDKRIAVVHGKMKSEEKDGILKAFAAGETDVLVSTTVIEVGINVPNATVMIIENAERFGLAQLHQLRGRVGRGSEKSYCILISDNKSEITRQRLKTMTSTTDGFKISETDLKLRGPGEFFGTRQHGLPSLRIANLYRDMAVLKNAQKAAQELIKKDPELEAEENSDLKNALDELFLSDNIGI